MAQIICIYVGNASDTNLAHGIKNGIWGFREDVALDLKKNFNFDKESYVLLASGYSGGSPRVQPGEWIKFSLNKIYLAKISTGLIKGDTAEWPDEKAKNTIIYSSRFRFDPGTLFIYENVPLNRFSKDIAERLRNSAIAQSRGYLIQDIDIQNLKNDLSGLNVSNSRNPYLSLKIIKIKKIQ